MDIPILGFLWFSFYLHCLNFAGGISVSFFIFQSDSIRRKRGIEYGASNRDKYGAIPGFHQPLGPDTRNALTSLIYMEQYQVFINHQGPNTKNTLASFIYHNLTLYSLRTQSVHGSRRGMEGSAQRSRRQRYFCYAVQNERKVNPYLFLHNPR